MQKCPNKCARFPQGLAPTAAKEVVQSVWNTFHRSIFTTPRIKAGVLCSCGNAEASTACTLQEHCCIPERKESRCPSSWVRDAREPGQFCFTEGNCQCYRGRDRENLLIYKKGARERIISGKTYAFAGTSVHCNCVESKDIALSTRSKAGPPCHIYQQTHRSYRSSKPQGPAPYQVKLTPPYFSEIGRPMSSHRVMMSLWLVLFLYILKQSCKCHFVEKHVSNK